MQTTTSPPPHHPTWLTNAKTSISTRPQYNSIRYEGNLQHRTGRYLYSSMKKGKPQTTHMQIACTFFLTFFSSHRHKATKTEPGPKTLHFAGFQTSNQRQFKNKPFSSYLNGKSYRMSRPANKQKNVHNQNTCNKVRYFQFQPWIIQSFVAISTTIKSSNQ